MYRRYLLSLFLCVVMIGVLVGGVRADEFSSSNYTVLDPVLFPGGGYSTSASFGVTGLISQMAIGSSTGENNLRNLFGGFMYYPFVSTPILSLTPASSQVTLDWTAPTPGFGWAVSGYTIGQSTVSGGPYTYISVGNTLSAIRTGLTNGTPYYFVIRVIDAQGNFIATSSQVSATPTGSTGGSSGSSGGSSSSGSSSSGTTSSNSGSSNVIFSGRAYPGSTVTLLKDAQIAVETVAGPDARFTIKLSALSAGDFSFSLYSTDSSGRRSTPITFPVKLTTGASTDIGGIFLAPTIAVDKEEVKKGDTIAIFGQSVSRGEVTIQVNSAEPFFVKTPSDNSGVYLYNFDTAPLELGNHSARSKAATSTEISPYGAAVGFIVGNKNVLVKESTTCKIADLNCDGKVNLVDFSILLFWYKKSSPPPEMDLNKDAKVDLIDFSIFAYHWTG